ncbi:sucrose-6-phosphate hydrolase [bacterium]|nr:sucrose-6-phosphate hydrolase [bacterium]
MDKKDLTYLATYLLQQDMRIRMPKNILQNMGLEKGKSKLEIFYDPINSQLILRNDNINNKTKGA